MLKVNEKAPDFTLVDQNGESRQLTALLSQGDLILYFYPIDFSPVCTAEACAFRDNYAGLESLGIQIVGVSPQDGKTHARFAKDYQIPFPLLADPKKKVIKNYGVDGPLGFGVRRVTFHIDQQGIVQNRVISDLFVGSHLQLLEETKKGKQS